MKKVISVLMSLVLASTTAIYPGGFQVSSLGGQSLFINEIMASNTSTLRDGDTQDEKDGVSGGAYSDWIELYNASNEAINLEGYSLSDSTMSWVFPTISIPAKGYLVVWASDKNKIAIDGQLHTNFKLSASGESVVLKTPNGEILDSVTFGSLSNNESFGRKTDGGNEFVTYATSSPKKTNSESLILINEPQFSHQGGFYTDEFSLELSKNQQDGEIYYTFDGSEPSPDKPGTYLYKDKIKIKSRTGDPNILSMIETGQYYWNPPVGEVFKCTTIKAAVVRGDGKTSKVVSRSYFVDPNMLKRYDLPVISIIADKDSLFNDFKGIYVKKPLVEDKEIKAHIEFFEKDGTLGFSKYCGIRLHGAGSNGFSQKSLRVYADRGYDDKEKINYEIFKGLADKDGKSIKSFKRLILRNSGTDWSCSMFRDGMMQSLVADTKLDTQAYRPSIVFINGEYWGIHNIRERYDNIYFASHYNLDKDKVAMLEVSYTGNIIVNEGTQEDSQEYSKDIVDYLKNNDISQSSNYEYLKTKMDVDNYIDYQIANIYFANTDWPQNNVCMWKYKTEDGLYHKDAPYGQDGRWRWIIKDTDFGFCGPMMGAKGITNDTLEHASLTAKGNEWAVFLFKSLLNNSEFRNQFVRRLADYLNTRFDSLVVTQKIDDTKSIIESSIPEHNKRWQAISDWEGEVALMKTFAKERPANVRQHVIKKYGSLGITGTVAIELNSETDKGFIRVNSTDVKSTTPGIKTPESWNATYFKGVPIEIKAIPLEGFVFDHWEGVDQKTDTINITPVSDIKVKAVFRDEVKSDYKVSGYVNPDLNSTEPEIKAQFKVEVLGSNISAVTDKNGYFELLLPSNTSDYCLKVSKSGYLTREVKNIEVTKDTVLFLKDQPLSLWAGDVEINGKSDGVIDFIDVMQIAKVFGSSSGDENFNSNVDFNKDKSINMADVLIIAKHFNATTEY